MVITHDKSNAEYPKNCRFTVTRFNRWETPGGSIHQTSRTASGWCCCGTAVYDTVCRSVEFQKPNPESDNDPGTSSDARSQVEKSTRNHRDHGTPCRHDSDC